MRSFRSLSRRTAVLSLLALAVLVPAAAAVNPGPPPLPISGSAPPTLPQGVTATLSTNDPGAKPVMVTLVLPASLICGRPLGTTSVTLPSAADVPASIGAGDVTVNTLPVKKVAISGSTVTFGTPVQKGVMCHSITQGVMRIVFTRAAGLGNPSRAGTFAVAVKHGAAVQRGTFVIR
jgi:hypothetical protein